MTVKVIFGKDGEPTPATLANVEQWASEHKTQATIAASLGLSRKAFEKRMQAAKGENALRLAWERGNAVFEQAVTDQMRSVAMGDLISETDAATGEVRHVRVMSKAAIIALIYFTKARLGWKEKEEAANIDNRVQINYPAPMTRDEYFAALGIDKPHDTRIPALKDVSPEAQAVALLMLPGPVSPADAGLPTWPAPAPTPAKPKEPT